MWCSRKLSLICFVVLLIPLSGVSPVLAKDHEYTGKCVCKKKGNVLATYSETTSCTKAKDHPGCGEAKQKCLDTYTATCEGMGGKLSSSSDPCGKEEC